MTGVRAERERGRLGLWLMLARTRRSGGESVSAENRKIRDIRLEWFFFEKRVLQGLRAERIALVSEKSAHFITDYYNQGARRAKF